MSYCLRLLLSRCVWLSVAVCGGLMLHAVVCSSEHDIIVTEKASEFRSGTRTKFVTSKLIGICYAVRRILHEPKSILNKTLKI